MLPAIVLMAVNIHNSKSNSYYIIGGGVRNHQYETPQNINGLSLQPILLTDLDLMLVNQWMRLKIKKHF